MKVTPGKAPSVKKGATGEATLSITVEKGFHVQANPATEKYLIPTTLTPTPASGIEAGVAVYPTPKMHTMKGAEKPIATYDETFVIKMPVTISPTAKSGAHKLPAKLRYQACNDITCFFPKTVDVSFDVKVP